MRFLKHPFSWVLSLLLLCGCSTSRIGQVPALNQAALQLKQARSQSFSTETKVELYLESAAAASKSLEDPAAKSRARTIYNDAAAQLTVLLGAHPESHLWTDSAALPAEHYHLRIQPGTKNGSWAAGSFTEFRNANQISKRHIRHPVSVDGLGGTVVGVHKTPGLALNEHAPFEPRSGLVAPVTSTLSFEGKQATLVLNDPAKRTSTMLNGHSYALAADFSAPIAIQPRSNELWLGLMSMIRVEEYLRSTGLYLLQPYDPDRIPVIFVHGLMSTPQMWSNVINELEADPELRGRFQYWVFRYPTGNPVSYSAFRLREELAKIRQLHPLRHGVILVGHSMGGIVSHMQAINPGRSLWDTTLGKKADRLYTKLPSTNLIKRALVFKTNPDVQRIVYICVPHRGSGLAISSLGTLAVRLITLPATLVATATESLGDALVAITGTRTLPAGITSLSPNNRLLKAMDTLPTTAPHHSIIGDRGKGNSPHSSDGIVPYWSSHLNTAESELIVPGPHSSYELPQTVAELKRILHLQLNAKRQR